MGRKMIGFDRKRLMHAIVTVLQTGPKSSNEIAMELREMKHQDYSFWVNGQLNETLRRLIGLGEVYTVNPDGQKPFVYALTYKKAA